MCAHRRPAGGKPSCAGSGSRALLRAFELALAERPELWGEIAVTASGCLGPCFDGPNVVVYPQGTWYRRVGPADVDAIVSEHLLGGTPVARLVLDWDEELADDD